MLTKLKKKFNEQLKLFACFSLLKLMQLKLTIFFNCKLDLQIQTININLENTYKKLLFVVVGGVVILLTLDCIYIAII